MRYWYGCNFLPFSLPSCIPYLFFPTEKLPPPTTSHRGRRSTLPHTNPSETSTWVQRMTAAAQNGVSDFIIVHKATASPIGKIGVWQDQEIGFLLSRSYWGQGLAQEALHGVLPYLFGEKGMEEITADVDPRNHRSIRLLERVGFVTTGFKERTWEIGSEWVDSLYLGLRRERWEGGHSKDSDRAEMITTPNRAKSSNDG
ncbi:hypothetical protein A1O7_05804 [Cladophialophora yegresii CBS 114405]|uniref:N-acetyltransferase domain-containing protein n=1 Tax=Cladophialophora yegresii CBS 114405 TaxID=1182544 RepID=W9WIR7_9EURO|nr:uncharacterized protein A1O7_05804 [Cladophialophora yegresii CBS 114405]EXJ58379.1 hypothetical protein A1O7_05804 [Cladophialophora yegresii CBS 114405]